MTLLIPSEPKSLTVIKTKYKPSLETGLSFVFCLCLFTVNVSATEVLCPPPPSFTPGNRFQHLLLRTKQLVHAVSRDGIIRKVLQGQRGFRRRRHRFWAQSRSLASLEYFISKECGLSSFGRETLRSVCSDGMESINIVNREGLGECYVLKGSWSEGPVRQEFVRLD